MHQSSQPGKIFLPEDPAQKQQTDPYGQKGRNPLSGMSQKSGKKYTENHGCQSQDWDMKWDSQMGDFQESSEAQEEVQKMGCQEADKIPRHAVPGQKQI